jgi:hypothetical protein
VWLRSIHTTVVRISNNRQECAFMTYFQGIVKVQQWLRVRFLVIRVRKGQTWIALNTPADKR